MKLLLGESLPQDFRYSLAEHDVLTVGYVGWKGVRTENCSPEPPRPGSTR